TANVMKVAFAQTITRKNPSIAVRSFPGEQEKKSYLQGRNFNETLAARERQQALGWTAEIAEAERRETGSTFSISIRTESGAPVRGLALTGTLSRPIHARDDQYLAFTEIGDGVYRAQASSIDAGRWVLATRAEIPGEAAFSTRSELTLQ
ncbi:MAG: FixH family protein, partial [Pseudomonadota bacterium]